MRTLLRIVLGAMLLFAAARMGWPALITLIFVALLSYALLLWAKGGSGDRPLVGNARFFAILALLLTIALFVIWQIGELLFGELGTEWAARYPLLLDSPLAKVFLAALVGSIAVGLIFGVLLLGVGIAGAPLVYGSHEGYKGHEREAIRSVIDSALGRSKGIWQVSNGKAAVINAQVDGLERFGGPGTLLVQEGHAVILEKVGALSRIVSRGITWLQPMERVAAVIELSSHSVSLELENVLTQDGAIIDKMQAWIFFRVMKGDPNKPGYQPNGRYPFNDDLVYKLWDTEGATSWQSAIKAIAGSSLRDVVARYSLDTILADSAAFRAKVKGDRQKQLGTKEFRGDLCEQINRTTVPFFAVEATAADLGNVDVSSEVKRQVMEKWMADWETKIAKSQKEATVARGEADATALFARETARAKAQEQMIGAISRSLPNSPGRVESTAKEVIAFRFIEALEKMASEHKGDLFLSGELLSLLRTLFDSSTGEIGASAGGEPRPPGVPPT